MIGAFAYLAWRSVRNRIARQMGQLRRPRYLVAFLLGLAYLWVLVLGQRPRAAPDGVDAARLAELVVSVLLAAVIAWGWLFGTERRALRFSPAEVTWLFPAPVSRRALVQYKLVRTQVLVLANTLLWSLLLSRERFGTSAWLRALSIWVLLTTLSFHRLGASFVRATLAEHGWAGARRRIVSLTIVLGVIVALAWSVADAVPALRTAWERDVGAWLAALGQVLERPVPAALLLPFRVLVRPLTAPDTEGWLRAVAPAAGLLAAHYVWVVRSDAAFEDAAAEAALARARAGEARSGQHNAREVRRPSRTRAPFPLAPTGWPGGAILWKNLVAIVRTRRVRAVALALGAASLLLALLSYDPDGTLAELAGWLAATWAGLLLVLGPQWVRNDLRGDLARLALLRSYPLRGRTVVLAEAGASALSLTLVQLGLLLLAYLAFLGNRNLEIDLAGRTLLLVAALVGLPAINFLGMLIHNAAALLYPGWVQPGTGRPGGVEALGQNMLLTVAFLGLLGLALAGPVALGGGGFLLFRPLLGEWALLPAGVVALGALGLEARAGTEWLGKVFERTDPPRGDLPS